MMQDKDDTKKQCKEAYYKNVSPHILAYKSNRTYFSPKYVQNS